MALREDLIKFTNGISQTPEKSIKYVLFHGLKMFNQLNDIRRYVKKEIQGDKNLKISSQDLRSYSMALDKVLKLLNKKSNFSSMQKRIEKEFIKQQSKSGIEFINYDMIKRESNDTIQYIKTAQLIQGCYSWVNHCAWLVYLIECAHVYSKNQSDNALSNAINEVIEELSKC